MGLSADVEVTHRIKTTPTSTAAGATAGAATGSMPSLTPDALIHQANALLGRAGLLAASIAGADDSGSSAGQQQTGVLPLGSMADLRAAAPALAVAVFEALLQVCIERVSVGIDRSLLDWTSACPNN